MVEIGFNCPENINDMTPHTKGALCLSCNKVITDFTGMSNREIQENLKKATKEQCGIFKATQVVNPYRSELSALFRLAFAAVFLFGLSANSLAQDTTQVEPAKSVIVEDKVVVRGTVREMGDELGLPFARVYLTINNVKYGGITDFDGKYAIEVPKAEVGDQYFSLTTTFIGYDTTIVQNIYFDTEDTINIDVQLIPDNNVIIVGLTVPAIHQDHYQNRRDPYNFGRTVITGEDLERF